MSATPSFVPRVVAMHEGRFVDARAGRLLVLILSCDKYKGRADGIRYSWQKLAPANHTVLYVHGSPGAAPHVEGDRLYVDCPESYERLPLKVHRMLEYAVRELEFDYIFKTDDDTYIDLETFISFDRESADYIGQFREQPVGMLGKTWHYGKCDDKSFETPWERPFVCPWATGGGYFLSRKAAALAVQRTARACHEDLFEDMMIGEALTQDPTLRVRRALFSEMGIINPLLPKDMLYVQSLLQEKRGYAVEVLRLAEENARLAAMLDRDDVGTGATAP